jgi:hypothetical protein
MKTYCVEDSMLSHSSIKQLNRKTYLAFHRDGIIDILIGLTFFGFGLWLLLDNVLFTYISWLSFGVYRYMKKTITIPRFGYVRFEEDKKQSILLFGFGIILLVLLLVARFYLLETDLSDLFISSFLRKNHVYIMSSIGAVLLMIFGFWRGIYRFGGYGFLLFGTLVIFFLEGIPGRNALFMMGGLMFAVGLILLVTFIQRNPVQSREVDSAA